MVDTVTLRYKQHTRVQMSSQHLNMWDLGFKEGKDLAIRQYLSVEARAGYHPGVGEASVRRPFQNPEKHQHLKRDSQAHRDGCTNRGRRVPWMMGTTHVGRPAWEARSPSWDQRSGSEWDVVVNGARQLAARGTCCTAETAKMAAVF